MSVSTPLEEPAEAVIISGPRRGQIINLSEGADSSVRSSDWRTLNAALDDLNAKLAAMSQEIRATTKSLRPLRRRR